MSKKKSYGSGHEPQSITEKLIEEASLFGEDDQGEADNSEVTISVEDDDSLVEEARPKPSADSRNRTTGPIAKIDLQKFIDRETYLRLAADFENFRKRALKDRQESERNGAEKVLRGFLDILDNIDRGLLQAEREESPLLNGLQMIVSQIEAWLRSFGLERIQTKGLIFDPNLHEAITQVESNQYPAGTILEELTRGYRWADRLLRPAGVVVSKASRGGEQ